MNRVIFMDFITSGKVFYPEYRLMLNHLDHSSVAGALDDCSRFKLVFIESGIGKLKLNQIESFYSAPAVICINESENLAMENPTAMKMQALYFHPGVINDTFNFNNVRNPESFRLSAAQDWYFLSPFILRDGGYNGVINISLDFSDRISVLFLAIKNELENQPKATWPCRSRSFLLELLIIINSILSDYDKSEPEEPANPVLEIKAYLQTHYNEKITVPDLARKFNMNRTTLNRRFVKETQSSVIEYLIRLRIQMASAFMRDTLLNISEIMDRVGFASHTHFWRMFKKQTGFSPSEYRLKYCWMKE